MGAAHTSYNSPPFPGPGPSVGSIAGPALGKVAIKEDPNMHYGNDEAMKKIGKRPPGKRRPKRLPPQTDPPTMPPGRGGRKMHRGPRNIAINPMNEMMGKGGGMRKMDKEEI